MSAGSGLLHPLTLTRSGVPQGPCTNTSCYEELRLNCRGNLFFRDGQGRLCMMWCAPDLPSYWCTTLM